MIAYCADCKHWRKLKSLPYGRCMLPKDKGLHDSMPKPLYEDGGLLLGDPYGVFQIFTTDRDGCSEWVQTT